MSKANKNETAVNYFHKTLKRGKFTGKDTIDFICEAAIDIEKEQIKEAYKAGFNYRDTFNWECDAPWDSKADLKHNEQAFEQYYNETYKGGEL